MKLEVKNLHKSFGEKEVLHGISFEVEDGKALGLLGRNGAGKTTTIRILMGVFGSNEGEILLDGKPFLPSNHQIGYLPEERGLYPKKKILDQMVYLAQLRGISKSEAKTNSMKWLNRLGLGEYAGSKLETLSKGNQQKVQLASTLSTNPSIVILDEPFSGLDPVNAQTLKDIVMELIQNGKLVIFSSHQMSYVEEFCDDIVIINQGDVVLKGNLAQIKKEFGQNQLVLNVNGIDAGQLKDVIEQKFEKEAAVTGVKREYCIIRLNDQITKHAFLEKLVQSNLDLEHFETYKPSLNDIFVAKAGDNE